MAMAVSATPGELDFPEPTNGVGAMEIRILRAELLAGNKMSLFNALDNGGESLVEQGGDSQPRTTSNGEVLSVAISVDQNKTLYVPMGRSSFRVADQTVRYIQRRIGFNYTPVCGASTNRDHHMCSNRQIAQTMNWG